MNGSTGWTQLAVGALAALFLLWLATWIVLGGELYGPSQHNWDEALAAAVTGLVAFIAARRGRAPYRGFLALQGVAFLFLAASWVVYPWSSEPAVAAAIHDAGVERQTLISNAVYALCVFTALCAWGYLALERWRERPLSTLTVVVFAVLMAGLGGILAAFYSGGTRAPGLHGRPTRRRDRRVRVRHARGRPVLHAAPAAPRPSSGCSWGR